MFQANSPETDRIIHRDNLIDLQWGWRYKKIFCVSFNLVSKLIIVIDENSRPLDISFDDSICGMKRVGSLHKQFIEFSISFLFLILSLIYKYTVHFVYNFSDWFLVQVKN